jgi:hypothetical protein
MNEEHWLLGVVEAMPDGVVIVSRRRDGAGQP